MIIVFSHVAGGVVCVTCDGGIMQLNHFVGDFYYMFLFILFYINQLEKKKSLCWLLLFFLLDFII